MNLKALIRAGTGVADIGPLLGDARAFATAADQLTAAFADRQITAVACIEGRGFLFGAPVAYRLGAGVIPLRAAGRLRIAGPLRRQPYTDYTGEQRRLEMAADAVPAGARVLIIDDWIQTGGTVRAAIRLIEQGSAIVAGIGAVIDDMTPAVRAALGRYRLHALARIAPGDPF